MMTPFPIQPNDANVFVIEDNPDNLFVTQTLLSDAGVRWQNARASGSMVFTWLATGDHVRLNPQFRLHLMLLDIQIPREDGYAVLTHIRQHPDPAFRATIIVAVTSTVTPAAIDRARHAGFDGFIGKPLDRHRFPDQIRRILAGEAVWEAS